MINTEKLALFSNTTQIAGAHTASSLSNIMNAVSLIRTIVLICTSSAIVQAIPIRIDGGFLSAEPLIEGLDKQPFINQAKSSSFGKNNPHKGCAGPTAEDDGAGNKDPGCFLYQVCCTCCGCWPDDD